MKLRFIPYLLVPLAAVSVLTAKASTPTPGFTISATNVTMTPSGVLVPFTVTSVNGFVGSVTFLCTEPNPPAGVKVPACVQGGPIQAITLSANGTSSGEILLGPYVLINGLQTPVGASSLPTRRATGYALAGLLALGLGLGSRKKGRFRLQPGRLLLVGGLMLGLMGLGACGGGPDTLTPGIYTYTLTASDGPPNDMASTTFQVTVPAGIVITTAPLPI